MRQVARLIGVSENQVAALIRERSLRARRVGNDLRIDPADLEEWAALNGRQLPADFAVARAAEAAISLAEALERGGIHHAVAGPTRDEVLLAVSLLPTIPAHVDRNLLHGLLVARERLCPTASGRGVAIPHPRDPLRLGIEDSWVALCFLEHPVDLLARDGKPVTALFVLLAASVTQHLQLLSQIAFALNDAAIRHLLRLRAPPGAISSRLRSLEAAPAGAEESSEDAVMSASESSEASGELDSPLRRR